jgi:hypothetical protein
MAWMYTLSHHDTFIHTHTESYQQHYLLFHARLVTLLYLVYFRINGKHLLVQNTTALDSLHSSIIKTN